jgi:hypothetical protein
MTIIARYAGRTVEVQDVFTGSSGRRLALVRRINGEPFIMWTHGGWCESDYANAPIDLIDLHIDIVLDQDQSCSDCMFQEMVARAENYERMINSFGDHLTCQGKSRIG